VKITAITYTTYHYHSLTLMAAPLNELNQVSLKQNLHNCLLIPNFTLLLSQTFTVWSWLFCGHRPKCFWNDQKKFSHFSQNVWKYQLMHTVKASFDTTVGQMTEIS